MNMKRALVAAALCGAFAAAQAAGFTLSSPDIKPGAMIAKSFEFNGFGCSGENKSPALTWSGAPKGTKSFAVSVYDPDAPTGSGWWHWYVVNIPANATKLAPGAGDPKRGLAPAGSVQGRNDYGAIGYGGPCPPPGDKPHRYIFTVFALKTPKIDLDASASAAVIGFNLNANVLAKATVTAYYGR